MVISSVCPRSLSSRALLIAGGFWLCLSAAEPVLPAEDDQGATAAEHETGLSGHTGTSDTQAKKQALSFGFVMLGCIIVGGALLLALVVIWGNRTRRLAQSPLPPVSKRDELWFLKPKKDSQEDSQGDVKGDLDQGTDPGTN